MGRLCVKSLGVLETPPNSPRKTTADPQREKPILRQQSKKPARDNECLQDQQKAGLNKFRPAAGGGVDDFWDQVFSSYLCAIVGPVPRGGGCQDPFCYGARGSVDWPCWPGRRSTDTLADHRSHL